MFTGFYMAELSISQKRDILTKIISVLEGHDLDGSIRKELFTKPNIATLRLWFNNSSIKLTRAELQVVKKKATWEIISKVIITQNLDSNEIIEWYEILPPINRSYLWVIMMSNIKLELDYRIGIVNSMINSYNPNYVRSVIEYCDSRILAETDYAFCKAVLSIIVGVINENNSNGQTFLKSWSNTKNLNKVSKIYGFESIYLYELTGLEQYLPNAAKEIFLF